MKWKLPPKIKVHEALGCIGDKRITVNGDGAEVFSSSRKKKYVVSYNVANNTIISNDNGSYWVGYLGYPAIAFLMLKGTLTYQERFAEALKGIPWKDLNIKFKNDYKKTLEYIEEIVATRRVTAEELNQEVGAIYKQIKQLSVGKPEKKIKPPEGH